MPFFIKEHPITTLRDTVLLEAFPYAQEFRLNLRIKVGLIWWKLCKF